MYDFCVKELRIIIEYHGTAFHPKSWDDPTWKHPYDKSITSEQVYNRDNLKKNKAIEFGYDYYVVWSDATVGFIENMKKVILGKYEKFENNIERFI